MKRVLFFIVLAGLLGSCGNRVPHELVGVQDRENFYQPQPFGMLFIPMGSYNMGYSDQDVPYANTSTSKTVSVQAFYMDETEVTNNEYRQFVDWVRDSLAHTILGDLEDPETYGIHYVSNKNDEPIEYGIDMPYKVINWKEKLRWEPNAYVEDEENPLEELFLPENERYWRVRQIDTRKLIYSYEWIDMRAAAARANREQGRRDRSVFIQKRTDAVYPDTLAWVHDFAYSFNDPMAMNYFWHPAYDHYPVVGVSWIQARAFCSWRTQLMNSYLRGDGQATYNEFRLPTESEWEWAARGGLNLSPYPWGGPYVRNVNGCFLANYKPLRGNYIDDGGFQTLIVAHYAPNDFGLYDMAGNVAEWTSNAFDESAYSFAHDMNMDYTYEAKKDDPPVMKRKVIRGGSWKDIGFYIRTDSRTYEFQDTAKCYVGFRCAQTYLGRQKGDSDKASNVYN